MTQETETITAVLNGDALERLMRADTELQADRLSLDRSLDSDQKRIVERVVARVSANVAALVVYTEHNRCRAVVQALQRELWMWRVTGITAAIVALLSWVR